MIKRKYTQRTVRLEIGWLFDVFISSVAVFTCTPKTSRTTWNTFLFKRNEENMNNPCKPLKTTNKSKNTWFCTKVATYPNTHVRPIIVDSFMYIRISQLLLFFRSSEDFRLVPQIDVTDKAKKTEFNNMIIAKGVKRKTIRPLLFVIQHAPSPYFGLYAHDVISSIKIPKVTIIVEDSQTYIE